MAARKKVGTKEAALREKRKQKVAANIMKQTGASPEKADRAAERFVSRSGRKKATTRKASTRRKVPATRRKAAAAPRRATTGRTPARKAAGAVRAKKATVRKATARKVTSRRKAR